MGNLRSPRGWLRPLLATHHCLTPHSPGLASFTPLHMWVLMPSGVTFLYLNRHLLSTTLQHRLYLHCGNLALFTYVNFKLQFTWRCHQMTFEDYGSSYSGATSFALSELSFSCSSNQQTPNISYAWHSARLYRWRNQIHTSFLHPRQ